MRADLVQGGSCQQQPSVHLILQEERSVYVPIWRRTHVLGDWLEIQGALVGWGACGEGTQGREGEQEASALVEDRLSLM